MLSKLTVFLGFVLLMQPQWSYHTYDVDFILYFPSVLIRYIGIDLLYILLDWHFNMVVFFHILLKWPLIHTSYEILPSRTFGSKKCPLFWSTIVTFPCWLSWLRPLSWVSAPGDLVENWVWAPTSRSFGLLCLFCKYSTDFGLMVSKV